MQVRDFREKLTPPPEHNDQPWHWLDTTQGLLCASWRPGLSNHGMWDISGTKFSADSPLAIKTMDYIGPAIPPTPVPQSEMTARLIVLAEGLECSTPEGRLDAAAVRWALARL